MYEGRKMIDFPVEIIDNLISLAPLSVLLFPKFVIIILTPSVFVVELRTSLKTFLLKNDLQYCFLSNVQWHRMMSTMPRVCMFMLPHMFPHVIFLS